MVGSDGPRTRSLRTGVLYSLMMTSSIRHDFRSLFIL